MGLHKLMHMAARQVMHPDLANLACCRHWLCIMCFGEVTGRCTVMGVA